MAQVSRASPPVHVNSSGLASADFGKSQMHIESLVELVAFQLPLPREATSQGAAPDV